MTTIFVPIIRKDQLDNNYRVKSNHISLAGYFVDKKCSTNSDLFLHKNTYYFQTDLNMASIIHMKKPVSDCKVTDAIDKGKWPNLILDWQFITKKDLKDLKRRKANIWTRPVDRTMLLIPLKKDLEHNKKSAMYIGSSINKKSFEWEKLPRCENNK